eukprot:6205580-Pleurochrysis_carterae.AAC.2
MRARRMQSSATKSQLSHLQDLARHIQSRLAARRRMARISPQKSVGAARCTIISAQTKNATSNRAVEVGQQAADVHDRGHKVLAREKHAGVVDAELAKIFDRSLHVDPEVPYVLVPVAVVSGELRRAIAFLVGRDRKNPYSSMALT